MKQLECAESGYQKEVQPDFIGYHKTMNILEERWQATEEELAAWIFWGPEHGGIAAYIGAFNPPEPFSFSYASPCRDYLPLLNRCCFRLDDIENFKPVGRYITGKVLFKRWGHVRGGPSSFIRARIEESRLLPLHPTCGTTQGVFHESGADTLWPTLEEGLFLLEHVELIEIEEGIAPLEKENILTHPLKGKIMTQQQNFRGLCIDELRKYARLWVEDFQNIPITSVTLYEYHSRWSPYFKRCDQDLRCPLYVVVFEIPGLKWPSTHKESKNWPLTEEDICAPSLLDGHPWRDFLEKLDNVPGCRFQRNSHFLYPGFECVYNNPPLKSTWWQDWLFVAVDNVDSLPKFVDRHGPTLILLPLLQAENTFHPLQKQATADQATPVVDQVSDELTWTWPRLEKITKLSRRTIQKRAEELDIKFEERHPKRGHMPEKGLRESDWRRIVNKK